MHGNIGTEAEGQTAFRLLTQIFFRILRPADRGILPMPLVYSGDYVFEQAGQFGDDYLSVGNTLVHFRELAAPFSASFVRIRFLHELPVQLIYWSSVMAMTTVLARQELGLGPNDSKLDGSTEYISVASSIFERQVGDIADVWAVGTHHLKIILKDEKDTTPASEGIEAVFAAMIMSAYAALETLAADLWIAAVNKKTVLAQNWSEKNGERQIPASVLAGYGFQIDDKMGTILHDTRKVSFESWNDVKKAYSASFKGECDSAFDPPEGVHRAEKTRHLFAHRGGLIDRKFRDEMASFPEGADLTVGDRLRLTGPIVRDNVAACLACGAKLLKAVDLWFESHP